MMTNRAQGLWTLTALCVLLLCGPGAALAAGCLDCHAGTVEGRTDVKGALNAASHHVQGVAATGRHCYACHWEATPDGRINEQYHAGTATEKNKGVDLVVWGAAVRPQVYRLHSTAVTFDPAAIALVLYPSAGPESFSYTLSEAWTAGRPVLVPPCAHDP